MISNHCLNHLVIPHEFPEAPDGIIIFPAFLLIFPWNIAILPRPFPWPSRHVGLQGVDPPGEGQLQKEEEEPATAEPWHLAVEYCTYTDRVWFRV